MSALRSSLRTLTALRFGTTVALRSASMAVGFVLNLVVTRVIISNYGVNDFALFSIIVSLLAALPFADLGLGAGIVNSTSDFLAKRLSREVYVQVVSRTLSILMSVGAIIMIAALVLGIAGAWPLLLGVDSDPATNVVSSIAVACLAMAVPLGCGTRILQGAGLTHLGVSLSFLGSATQAAGIAICFLLAQSGALYALGPAAAVLVVNGTTLFVSLRKVGLKLQDLGRPLRPSVRLTGDLRLWRSAVPYMMVTVGVAFTLQWQRVILAHVSTPSEVAAYSFAAQFTTAIMSVITMASLNMWASYRKLSPSPRKLLGDIGLFGAVGLLFGVGGIAAIFLALPWAGNGQLAVSHNLYLASAGLVLVWALARPGILYLNFPRGLWFQAWFSTACLGLSLTLTIYLGKEWGAAGAVSSNVLAILLFTVLPNSWKAVRVATSTRVAFRGII